MHLKKTCCGEVLLSMGMVNSTVRKNNMSHILRKPVFRVSDQVQHKPDCKAIEGG